MINFMNLNENPKDKSQHNKRDIILHEKQNESNHDRRKHRNNNHWPSPKSI